MAAPSPPDLADDDAADLAAESSLTRGMLLLAGVTEAEVEQMVHTCLATLLMQRFDAARFDNLIRDGNDGNDGRDGNDGNVGRDGHDGNDGRDGRDGRDGNDGREGHEGGYAPWLNKLVASPRWRQLLTDLRERHPESRLLNMLAARAAEDGLAAASDAADVGAVECGDGANALTRFLRALARQLRAVVGHETGAQDVLNSLCTSGEVRFLTALLVLRQLIEGVGMHAETLVHAAERLSAAAVHTLGADAQRIYLAVLCELPADSPLAICCLSLMRSQEVSAGDVRTMLTLSEKGVSLAALRRPPLYRLLVRALFHVRVATKRTPADRAALAQILLHASVDSTDDSKREETKAALHRALELCAADTVSTIAADSLVLIGLMRHAPVALGVLVWSHSNLVERTSSRFNVDCLPHYLRLMMAAATLHPQFRRQVCAVVSDCLRLEPEEASDGMASVGLKKQLMDCLLLLMADGCAEQVLAAIEEGLGSADFSLIRHSVRGLLSVTAPPYSQPFGARLLRILAHRRVLDAFRRADSRLPLLEALEHLRHEQPELSEPLSAIESALRSN